MNLYLFNDAPRRWQIGRSGSDVIYASCEDCGTENLAGFAGTAPTVEGMASIITEERPFGTPAAWCVMHLPGVVGDVDRCVI